MNAHELAAWFDRLLDVPRFDGLDPAQNGLQVENDGAVLSRVAFAVDACLQTIERAAAAGAGMLVVHHGLFWRDPERAVGNHYRRLKALLDANIALYACHLPLDAHPTLGNNAALASRLALVDVEPFGEYRGCIIGARGRFPEPVSLDRAIELLCPDGAPLLGLLPFGPATLASAAIVSGGGGDELFQALDAGVDLFVTGEIGHEEYHHALEGRISVVSLGHYRSETGGVKSLSATLGRETGIETVFIDAPTGL